MHPATETIDSAPPAWRGVDRLARTLSDDLATTDAERVRVTRLFLLVLWWLSSGASAAAASWAAAAFVATSVALWLARPRDTLSAMRYAPSLTAPVDHWRSGDPRRTLAVSALDVVGLALVALGTGWLGLATLTTSTTPNAWIACLLAGLCSGLAAADIARRLSGGYLVLLWLVVALANPVLCAVGVALGTHGSLRWPSVLGSGLAAVTALATETRLRALDDDNVTRRVRALRQEVQSVDARHIHQLKNIARPVYDDAASIPDVRLREGVRRLAIMLSATEVAFRQGLGSPSRGLSELVNGIRRIDERAETSLHVDADLDPDDLASDDAELVAIIVGDLATNALTAGADDIRVSLTAQPQESGSRLVLSTSCNCGRSIGPIDEGSSLMALAGLLEQAGGSLTVHGPDRPAHTFVAQWSTPTRLRARANIPESAIDVRSGSRG